MSRNETTPPAEDAQKTPSPDTGTPEAPNVPEDPKDTGTPPDAPAGSSADAPSAPAPKKSHPLRWLFCFLLCLCLGAGFFAWNEVRTFLDTPPEVPGRSVIVDIEPGMTLAQVSRILEKENVVVEARRFQLLARWKEQGRSLQAGRFLVNTGWKPEKVLDMLVSGKSMLYKVTIREGLPWWSVADLLEKEGFCKAEDFKAVIHDPEFLRHWSIPFGSAEGFLYPETYLLPQPREMDREAAHTVANRLVEMFWKQADKVWAAGRPAPEDLKRLVTLASIVEKETGVADERARVAGVYSNRLRIGMLLQADPTVIYGMGREFKGRLLYKHLDDEANRYNTYQHPGLPPGPICSFGAEALKAAVAPEQHDFLYFVATGKDRGHKFSKTLSEHNRAVREYRAAMRKKK